MLLVLNFVINIIIYDAAYLYIILEIIKLPLIKVK